jgi:hypothetical protein
VGNRYILQAADFLGQKTKELATGEEREERGACGTALLNWDQA